MTFVPELTYDIYYWIIQAVANSSTDRDDDRISIKTLLACCLVDHAWCRLAQPILNQTIVVNTENDLNRRILARSNDHHLAGLRNIVFRDTGEGHFSYSVDTILQALPKSSLLRSIACYDGARLTESSDGKDREMIGKSRISPRPLGLDLSGLHEAVLGSISFGPNWVPLLLVAPNLRYLTLHQCGWCVCSFTGFRLCECT
jgi:hypothetical protein